MTDDIQALMPGYGNGLDTLEWPQMVALMPGDDRDDEEHGSR